MTDAHIHLERGPYTLPWLARFTEAAAERGLDEIWLLEHCYRFREFLPMYEKPCAASEYFNEWFKGKAAAAELCKYLCFAEAARLCSHPVKLKFGLEVCYFREYEELVYRQTRDLGLDFLAGSVHFIDGFAFDHKPEHWQGRDVDELYRRYFETEIELAKCGIYDGAAHPDCIKLFGHEPSFSLEPYYEELAAALAAAGMCAEQSGGITRRTGARLGMEPRMLAAMKRHGVRIMTASDAHEPAQVGEYIKELETLI